ncbi:MULTISPECIES: hypothetical protein [Streptomyces]|uniref:Uncharacterized protein n=2 Tax=Streptomyces TaxID=1883 RepID=A0A2N8PGU6_STRNR|nr:MULTISPECIES: hypothetical protein [Streptomyces]PNE40228.1 hypothetical protein AOB60_04375 [Streptomyces noursei]SHL40791.1 hypothetical protein SAMN05216268_104208 [Streptomyces yunnanensis]
MRAALHASGLRAYWQRQYPWLREPGALAAAEAHVLGTLATLPAPYRVGYATALRLLPLAFRVAARRSLRAASAEEGRRGMRSVAALPGFAEIVRASTALALLGALDGRADEEERGGAHAHR